MRVRRLDSAQVVGWLDRAVFPDVEPVDFGGAAWWVAYDWRDNAVGFAGAALIDGVVYLRRCGVLPSARGRGLHRRLIRARVAHAKRAGANEIVTYTMPHNAQSMRSLIREGFMPTSEYGYVGSDVVYWSRPL